MSKSAWNNPRGLHGTKLQEANKESRTGQGGKEFGQRWKLASWTASVKSEIRFVDDQSTSTGIFMC